MKRPTHPLVLKKVLSRDPENSALYAVLVYEDANGDWFYTRVSAFSFDMDPYDSEQMKEDIQGLDEYEEYEAK